MHSCDWKRTNWESGFRKRPGCAAHVSEDLLDAIAEENELFRSSGLAMEQRRRWKLLMAVGWERLEQNGLPSFLFGTVSNAT